MSHTSLALHTNTHKYTHSLHSNSRSTTMEIVAIWTEHRWTNLPYDYTLRKRFGVQIFCHIYKFFVFGFPLQIQLVFFLSIINEKTSPYIVGIWYIRFVFVRHIAKQHCNSHQLSFTTTSIIFVEFYIRFQSWWY